METRSPHGDRPGKSLGASHRDSDPGYYPQSLAVFFLPKPVLGPDGPCRSPGQAVHLPTDSQCHLDLPVWGSMAHPS